jgi:hypothetical protein
MRRRLAAFGTVLALTVSARAEPEQTARVGDVYEISSDRESSFATALGRTGSSTDRDAMVERVIGVSDAGVEIEYDLPANATPNDRELGWQFPTRVLKSADGSLRLLNTADMEVRLAKWLKLAKLPRSACGHYYFTWNLFRVECDPQSVLPALRALDLRPPDLRDGGNYRDPDAARPTTFKRTAGTSGITYVAEMAVDPDTVRRDLAQGDVALGEISRKPVTYETALEKAGATRVSGTISVTFEVDADNNVKRRVKVTKLETEKPGEKVERRTTTETLDRRRIASAR